MVFLIKTKCAQSQNAYESKLEENKKYAEFYIYVWIDILK